MFVYDTGTFAILCNLDGGAVMKVVGDFGASIQGGALQKTASMEEFDAHVRLRLREMGFSRYVYLVLQLPISAQVQQSVPLFMSSYPSEWAQRYVANSYHIKDPLVLLALLHRTPFTWGRDIRIEGLDKEERQILNEAREFGLKRGVTIPIHGPRGEFSMFTAASDGPKSEFEDAVQKHGETLHVLAIHLNAALVDEAMKDIERNLPKLTTREKEVLMWTGRGKTSWEISRIIDRSEATVNFHLRSAMERLVASNKCHAVAKAIAFRLINP